MDFNKQRALYILCYFRGQGWIFGDQSELKFLPRFLFDPSLSAPLLRPEPQVPINVEEPGPPEGQVEESDEEIDNDHITPSLSQSSTTPLETSLLTLSDVPPAKVLATLHLDLVKERNKLKEPPKPLPNAPFFLPTAHEGVTPRFAAPLGEEENDTAAEAPQRPSLFEELTAKADVTSTLTTERNCSCSSFGAEILHPI